MATYNPKYSVIIISAKKQTQYDVTQAITQLSPRENDGEIAQHVSIVLANIQVDSQYLSDIFDVRDRVYVYADDGDGKKEVFRGYIWARPYSNKLKKELELSCYDNLIYFQESEEYQYFSAGYSTKSICNTICGNWGVQLEYTYSSITHPKLPLRGNLADIFLSDLLGEVKKKTGAKFVIRSTKDIVQIAPVGSNTKIYKLYAGKDGNAISTNSEKTMQGMITKVKIIGKEDDNDRAPVEATVNGNTSAYGTLQKVINVSSGTTLAEAKQEADELIKEKGKPFEKYSITAVDIPWIRKGDKVEIEAGDLSGFFIVLGIQHSVTDKAMALEVERA